MGLQRQTIVSLVHKQTRRLWCSRSLFQGPVLIYEAVMIVRHTSDGCRSVCSKTWPLLLILPLAPWLCFLFSVLHLSCEDRSRVCTRAQMLSNFLHVMLTFEFPFLEVGGLDFQERLVLQGLMLICQI